MSTLWSISQGFNFELTLQRYVLFPFQTNADVKKSHYKHQNRPNYSEKSCIIEKFSLYLHSFCYTINEIIYVTAIYS